MMQFTEYTALSTSNNGPDSKVRKIWKSLAVILVMGLIGLMVFLSQNFGRDSHHHPRAHAHEVTSLVSTEDDYVFTNLVKRVSGEEDDISDFLSTECSFASSKEIELDFSNYHVYLKKLFAPTETTSTQYHVSKIVKPKYTVEWVFGNSIDSLTGENEHFVIVFQINPSDNNKIFEMYSFSSKYNEESPELFHRRLHQAFDFNKNGQLCITEFPSMIGGITGFGNLEMSNSILQSYMNDNLNTHLKIDADDYVDAVLSDDSVNEINNFGDLRQSVQSGIMDGYFAMIESGNNNDVSCLYFDLSWNCDENSKYYNTYDEVATTMYRVSDSLFSNVCCSQE